ncbi:MAG: hypothetical protein QOE55_5583 [Acidobacteriaceae bacterium]|nr:hypothetical protein [Acidobacteriaceae bacterium]
MKIVETPKRPLMLPEDSLVGFHVATVQDPATHARYAFVEQWQAPWNVPSPTMLRWGVYDVTESGDIDLSKLSEKLNEVEEVIQKAGLKRSFPTFQTRV